VTVPVHTPVGDPWTTEGPWLVFVTNDGDPDTARELTLTRRFGPDELATVMAELTATWTWSQALFRLVAVRLVVRDGRRRALPAPGERPTPGAFAQACPLWNNGADAGSGQHVLFDRDGDGVRGEGSLTLQAGHGALLRARCGPDALGGEIVTSLFWHIHM